MNKRKQIQRVKPTPSVTTASTAENEEPESDYDLSQEPFYLNRSTAAPGQADRTGASSLNSQTILQLQRTIGNQGVLRLINQQSNSAVTPPARTIQRVLNMESTGWETLGWRKDAKDLIASYNRYVELLSSLEDDIEGLAKSFFNKVKGFKKILSNWEDEKIPSDNTSRVNFKYKIDLRIDDLLEFEQQVKAAKTPPEDEPEVNVNQLVVDEVPVKKEETVETTKSGKDTLPPLTNTTNNPTPLEVVEDKPKIEQSKGDEKPLVISDTPEKLPETTGKDTTPLVDESGTTKSPPPEEISKPMEVSKPEDLPQTEVTPKETLDTGSLPKEKEPQPEVEDQPTKTIEEEPTPKKLVEPELPPENVELANLFGKPGVSELKAVIGEDAFNIFDKLSLESLRPFVEFFLAQPKPLAKVNEQLVLLSPLLSKPAELELAKKALTLSKYEPAGAGIVYQYLSTYAAKGQAVYDIALKILAEKGNNPVEAGKAMTALAPFNYLESVKSKAETVAQQKVKEDTDPKIADAEKDLSNFEKSYLKEVGQKLGLAFSAKDAKSKSDKFRKFFNVTDDWSKKNAGGIRDAMNEIREDKLEELSGAANKIRSTIPGLEAKTTGNIADILKPLYNITGGEATANWAMEQAGTDLDKLKLFAELIPLAISRGVSLEDAKSTLLDLQNLPFDQAKALVDSYDIIKKLDPLSADEKGELVQDLAKSLDGQLDRAELFDLINLMGKLNGTKIKGLFDLLTPTIDSKTLDNLILELDLSGDPLDLYIRKFVPALSGKDFADLIHRLVPLDTTQIDTLFTKFQPDLDYPALLKLVKNLHPLDGNKIVALVGKLQTQNNPLTGVQINELVLAMEGAGGDKFDATVDNLVALGDNTGKLIYDRIQTMRGSLTVGGKDSKEVTKYGGDMLLSGTQIASQTKHVKEAGKTTADLGKYPHSHINPVGRSENLLWDDCDPAVSRHVNETAEDIVIRQQLALQQIFQIASVNKNIAQRVFEEQAGQKPRDMEDAATEDARSGGHVDDRHVLGTPGLITTKTQLQKRANHEPGYPVCNNIAGAYASLAASKNAMDAFMKALTKPQWQAARHNIITGTGYDNTLVVAVSGTVARLNQPLLEAPTKVYLNITPWDGKGGFAGFRSWPVP